MGSATTAARGRWGRTARSAPIAPTVDSAIPPPLRPRPRHPRRPRLLGRRRRRRRRRCAATTAPLKKTVSTTSATAAVTTAARGRPGRSARLAPTAPTAALVMHLVRPPDRRRRRRRRHRAWMSRGGYTPPRRLAVPFLIATPSTTASSTTKQTWATANMTMPDSTLKIRRNTAAVRVAGACGRDPSNTRRAYCRRVGPDGVASWRHVHSRRVQGEIGGPSSFRLRAGCCRSRRTCAGRRDGGAKAAQVRQLQSDPARRRKLGRRIGGNWRGRRSPPDLAE